jgi:hypothetical protein
MSERKEDKSFWQKADAKAKDLADENPTVAEWQQNSDTLARVVAMILSDKYLAGEIVSAWLTQNHKVLMDDPAATVSAR